jgi:hypothetical protein
MSREEDCAEDVRRLKQFADEIELTLDTVDALKGTDTWSGPGGDVFRTDWDGHRDAIRSALDAARAEADRVLTRVEEEGSEEDGGG